MRNLTKVDTNLAQAEEDVVVDPNAQLAVTGITTDKVMNAMNVLKESTEENWLNVPGGGAKNKPNLDILMQFDASLGGALMFALHTLMRIITEPSPVPSPEEGEYSAYSEAFLRFKAAHQKNVITAIGQVFKIAGRLPFQEVYSPAVILGGKRYPIPYSKENWCVVNGELQHLPTMNYWKNIMETSKNRALMDSAGTNERHCLHPSGGGRCIFNDAKLAPAVPVVIEQSREKAKVVNPEDENPFTPDKTDYNDPNSYD